MKPKLFIPCLVLAMAAHASGQETSLGNGVKFIGGLISYANLEGLKLNIERDINKEAGKWIGELKATPDEGILFDVPVYEINGMHATNLSYKGRGKTTDQALMKTLEYAREHGSLSASPPDGYTLSKEKSYMVWVKLDATKTKLVQDTVSSVNREVLYLRVRQELDKKK